MTDSRTPESVPASRRQRAIEAYGSARDRASGALDEAPLVALAAGLAAGAAIAALLPRTRTEDRLIKPVAKRARDTAKSAAVAANSSSARCCPVPLPGVAQRSFDGSAFAIRTNSARSFAG